MSDVEALLSLGVIVVGTVVLTWLPASAVEGIEYFTFRVRKTAFRLRKSWCVFLWTATTSGAFFFVAGDVRPDMTPLMIVMILGFSALSTVVFRDARARTVEQRPALLARSRAGCKSEAEAARRDYFHALWGAPSVDGFAIVLLTFGAIAFFSPLPLLGIPLVIVSVGVFAWSRTRKSRVRNSVNGDSHR